MNRVLLLLSLVCTTALGCQPMLRIYNDLEDGEIKKEILFVYDQPDLIQKNLTVERMYTCPEGVWMAYRNENFGGAEGERYILSGTKDGIFNCHFEGEGRGRRIIRSVKVVGDPGDYSASAVVTYQRTNNQGADLTYLTETAKANTTFQSMVLVGPVEIELFVEEDFRGPSFCVMPFNGDISGSAWFQIKDQLRNGNELYTNVMDLEGVFGTAEFKSFRFGCEVKSKMI